ncbi:Crp/Fnr family transcriptional regulator [Alcaligenaceae bacterium SJ-26]|nr:Crp/Fnr family transcriptional regulator [Alcaligenaceae bacterium SJ-26]
MTIVKQDFELFHARQLLSEHPTLAGLDAPLIGVLLNQAQIRHAKAGQTLFHEGASAQHYLLVLAGQIEIVRFSDSGEERVFGQFSDGQLVAETAMFMPHGRYPMNARARTDTRYCWLTRDGLRQACQQSPALAMRYLENMSMRVYKRINEVDWIAHSSAPQRLAAYLLDEQARQGTTIQLPLSQRQLASRLGIRAETLSRLLTKWQEQGYLEGRQRQWTLLDIPYFQGLSTEAQRAF